MSKAMLRRAHTQTIPISFTLNGRRQEIAVEPHELLLDVVRDRLGLTVQSVLVMFKYVAPVRYWWMGVQ